jgi:hypothetical protein
LKKAITFYIDVFKNEWQQKEVITILEKFLKNIDFDE